MSEYNLKIYRNPYDMGNLFTKANITLKSGVTVLVGCNGSGKTTLIRSIKRYLNDNKELVFDWDNYADGGINSMNEYLFHGDIESVSLMAMSSEGEKIYYNLGNKFAKIKSIVEHSNGKNNIFILMDAIDSGLSIDNVIEIKEFIHKILEPDIINMGIIPYIIIIANGYEFTDSEDCFDVKHCKYVRFKDYNDYKKFILNSRKEKDIRLKKYYDKLQREGNKSE